MSIRVHSVYEIVGPTGTYVGKTSMTIAQRMRAHRASARRDAKTHFHHALRMYGADAFTVTCVMQSLSETDVFVCEMLRIAQARADGVRLYNENDGGLSNCGRVQSAAEKAKRAKSMLGWAARCGYAPSAEARARMSEAHIGKMQPLAARVALGKMQSDPEIQTRRIASVRKVLAIRNADPANSARMKALWAARKAGTVDWKGKNS